MEAIVLKGDVCVGCLNKEHPNCDRANITWGGTHGQNIVGCSHFIGGTDTGLKHRDWSDRGFFLAGAGKAPPVKEPLMEPEKGKYVSNFE